MKIYKIHNMNWSQESLQMEKKKFSPFQAGQKESTVCDLQVYIIEAIKPSVNILEHPHCRHCPAP